MMSSNSMKRNHFITGAQFISLTISSAPPSTREWPNLHDSPISTPGIHPDLILTPLPPASSVLQE